MPKTPYELMYGKKPNIKHFHVLGYKVKLKLYNPHVRKLDIKIISWYFISYSSGSKGSKFHYLAYFTRIIELDYAIYF